MLSQCAPRRKAELQGTRLSWTRSTHNTNPRSQPSHQGTSQRCVASDAAADSRRVPTESDGATSLKNGICEHASLLRRNVESGESLEFEGTVVVMGDCRRGSSVKSAGNVIVLGRLLGRVAAGTQDDREAVVVAGEMQPHSIQIADVKLKPSYWQRAGSAFGQIAYIENLHPPSAEQVEPGDSQASIIQVCPGSPGFLDGLFYSFVRSCIHSYDCSLVTELGEDRLLVVNAGSVSQGISSVSVERSFVCAPVGKRASSSISMFPYTSIYYLEAAKAVRLPPAPSIIALQVPQGNPLVAQELNKMLPSGASQDEQDLDQPVQHEQLDGKEQTEQEKQISIKISPLARPYISFGPDIRQHPCAMYTTTPKMPEAAKSAAITGCYAMALGFALMIAPMKLFSMLFDPVTVSHGFVRLGGALLALFGLYYIGATLGNSRGGGVAGFYASTVAGRLLLAAFCVWLFIVGEVGSGIMFFAAMNGLGALAMARALVQDNEPANMSF